MKPIQADDFELLEAWRRGDKDAGEVLFTRYFDAVARFFRNKLPEPADDLVQRTFLACVEGRERLRSAQRFRSYLFGVAHNLLRSEYRARRREPRAPDFSVSSMFDLAPSPSTIAARNEAEHHLLETLRKLPLDLQVTLELHYWEHMPVKEIAEALQQPVGTIKTRLRRARQLVSDALTNEQTISAQNLENQLYELRQVLLRH